jgi:hypothetical protein
MKSVRILAIILICGGFSLLASRGSFANSYPVRPAAANSLPSSTPAAPVVCHPVVKLFGEPVCREEAKLEPVDESQFPNNSTVRRELLMQQGQINNMAMIKAIVWQKALIHKFGAAVLTPTDQEVEEFRTAFNDSMEKSFEADRKTATLLANLLAQNNYAPNNEKTLRRLLDAAQLSLKLYGERQQHTDALPKEYHFVIDTAERQVARNMLTSWKSDKALYDAYGGRLLVTDEGVVPLDAYIAFLKYIREDGKLEIIDPAYKDFLKEAEDYAAAQHQEMSSRGEVAKKYFSSPTWQFTLGNNSDRFSDLQMQLKKITTLGPKEGVNAPESELIGKQSRPASPIILPTVPEMEKKP